MDRPLLAVFVDKNNVMLTVDHILPKSKGGQNWQRNLQTLCASCNFEKDDSVLDSGQESG
jgi:5-methylcytosine-specific restriction endonuclease McrA